MLATPDAEDWTSIRSAQITMPLGLTTLVTLGNKKPLVGNPRRGLLLILY